MIDVLNDVEGVTEIEEIGVWKQLRRVGESRYIAKYLRATVQAGWRKMNWFAVMYVGDNTSFNAWRWKKV